MEKKLPKKTIILWQIRIIFLSICLILVIIGIFGFSSGAILVCTGMLLIFGILVVFYVPAFLKSYSIRIFDTAAVLVYGVIIKTSHIMPQTRKVYITTVSTPLAKLMGLSTVIFKASRGIIIMPELRKEDALLIVKEFAGMN